MAFCGYLRQSTTVTISFGPFLDDDDALTEKTGLTIADTTLFLSKNGAAKAAPNDTNDFSEDANGVYRKQIDTTDTNTLGLLTAYVHESDALYVRQDYQVVTQQWWDSMCSTDKLQVHTAEITAGLIANASFNADVGSTAHGTNIIALAVRKILEELNLDHLLKVADSDDVVNDTVIGKMASTDGDWSNFVKGDDSLQSLRDRGDSAWVTATGFALASVVGALADAAADGAVTEADTLMQYLKQLINILIGAPGIVAFPAEAAPANGVSLSEVIRAIHADVTGLNGSAMVGTNNAALASGVDVTKIHGTALNETSAGNLASNFTTFYDNADAATAKIVDDVGGAAGLEVDVTKVHGTALTESSPGNLAGNMSTFWDNADAATAKTVDDVGAPASGGGSPLVLNAGDVGDFKKDGVVHFFWNTIDRSGAAVAPSTAGTLRIYKDDGTGEVTAPTGITDTRAFDGVTGLQECKVDLSASPFYAKEKNYSVVLVGAVIDTKTVNRTIASFSIQNRWANVHFEYGG